MFLGKLCIQVLPKYIFADQGRNSEEIEQAAETRELVDEMLLGSKIEVMRDYATTNRGLKRSIINGLSEVFKHEKAAIILEDDCLPNQDFFKFTAEMLNKYQNSINIYSISGTSFTSDLINSYNFSKYQSCWGWATWANKWARYDEESCKLPDSFWKNIAPAIWPNIFNRLFWKTITLVTNAGLIDTWDYQWSFVLFKNDGLAIIPSRNYVVNVGFDDYATNTKTKTSVIKTELEDMPFPLVHPETVIENQDLSAHIESHYYKNIVAVLGLLRLYIKLQLGKYDHRN